jgi:hypothetical protein
MAMERAAAWESRPVWQLCCTERPQRHQRAYGGKNQYENNDEDEHKTGHGRVLRIPVLAASVTVPASAPMAAAAEGVMRQRGHSADDSPTQSSRSSGQNHDEDGSKQDGVAVHDRLSFQLPHSRRTYSSPESMPVSTFTAKPF